MTVVNITVQDFNDNAPIFLNPVARVLISENAPTGSVLADFNVTDRDSGPRGTAGVSFSIAAGIPYLPYCIQLCIPILILYVHVCIQLIKTSFANMT